MAQGSGGKASRTHAVAPSPDVVVNEFMSYDPAAKKVKLKLLAADGSDNGGLNFNGGSKGDQTITVPLGWAVHVDFLNKDAIPHSAIILPDKMPLPAAPDQPAIARAFTRDMTGGIPTDGTDTMDFTATPAGTFLFVCGVPGHGPSGMYIKFVVSGSAKVPAYQK
jgi:sulfocyanin